MSNISDVTLSHMVDVIVKVIQPEKIILFGSHAKGVSNPDSDVDFLIVDSKPFGPERIRRKEMARIWKALGKFMLPVDILLFTQTELESRMNSMNNVAARAIKEGRVLYDRH
ncbi:MAG: nucleotidyltransferase domain-containing protein [Candidatus Omnitrophota bacterium]